MAFKNDAFHAFFACAALCVACVSGCAEDGSCLRHTDCASDEVCHAGTCSTEKVAPTADGSADARADTSADASVDALTDASAKDASIDTEGDTDSDVVSDADSDAAHAPGDADTADSDASDADSSD